MIVIEKQGGVVAAYDPDYQPLPPGKVSKRGVITEMSRKSRRGLLLLLNRMAYDQRTSFVTLTFHNTPTVSQSNAAFKRFRAWITATYPGAAAVWRREVQPERGAIHFHLLIFNLPFIPQNYFQSIWTRCTQEDLSIVDIRRVRSRKHALRYVSKYIAKLPTERGTTSLELSPYLQPAEKKSVGRAWGWINAEALPFAPTERIAIDDPDVSASFWLLAGALTFGRCGNDAHIAILFYDDPDVMFTLIKRKAKWWTSLDPGEGKICYNKCTEALAN
jgi:hypothetical protein